MFHLSRRHVLVLLAVLAFVPLVARAEPEAPSVPTRDLVREEKEAQKVITARKGARHVAFLAGIKCEGRASGEKGCDVAADYIAEKLAEMGVEPGGNGGGWFQEFTVKAGPFPGQGRRTGREVKPAPTRNVIGILKGSDPEKSKELIVIGAHYDHLGYRDLRKRKVYWGACDNAGGTAVVMLVAEAFAQMPVKPRRSLMFLLFSGEERGLFGSKHYVGSPTWPLRETVAMINVDMIGRSDTAKIDVYGKGTGPELDVANEGHARASKLRFTFKGGSVFGRSDHYSFYQKDIPVLFLTCGMYKDYHDLDDEPKRMNWKQVERVAEHCWRLLREVGDLDERPAFEQLVPTGAAGVLGIMPQPLNGTQLLALKLGKKKGAIAVAEVKAGKAAAKAGVQPEDLILGLAGKYLTDRDPMGELDAIADDLKSGRKVAMLIMRDGKRQTVGIRVP